MEQRANSEQLIIRYLLGELSEEKQVELEAEYFTDLNKFNRFRAAEYDLIEGYVNDKLSSADRARFERNYMASPAKREQVQFFQTLSKTLSLKTNQSFLAQASTAAVSTRPAEMAGWWQSLLNLMRGPQLVPRLIFAAAVMIVVAGSVVLIMETIRLRGELTQTERDRAFLQQREQELKQQLDLQRADRDQLARDLESIQQRLDSLRGTSRQPAPATVSFSWTVGGLKRNTRIGVKTLRKLVIPAGTDSVQLTFNNLPSTDYASYRVALLALTGEEIWSRGSLKSNRTRSHTSIVLEVLAKQFPPGTYSLVLSGIDAGGEPADIGAYLIEVDSR